MHIGSYTNSPDQSASRSETRIAEAVRALITSIDNQRDAGSRSDPFAEREEVILDTRIEGFRYVLMRMNASPVPQVRLSPREQEIVRMVAKGHPNKVIADVLSISSWTVCTHLRRIFAKLGVASRAAMVARLMEGNPLGQEIVRAVVPQPQSSAYLASASRHPAPVNS
jgi:DNA-binding NarL/FixJ family response regulator